MRKSPIAIAVAGAFGAAVVGSIDNQAEAAVVNLDLIGTVSQSANGPSNAIVASSTATWSYDTVTDILTGTGLYKEQTQIAPIPGQLFTHNVVDPTFGGGGAAGATSYSCVEGSFGGAVGASLCGNYNFGVNFVNNSTVSWGPGTAYSRTIGGDDVSIGIQQNLTQYDGMSGSWNGTTLVMDNAVPGVGGYTMTFTAAVVPVPAAAWLFGSALGLLGWVRRRTTA